jgi:4-alpha-glucanotransferase
MLSALKDFLGHLPLIAEDLGVITPDVESLRDDFGLPGMKVLQFAFDHDPGNIHLPFNFPINSIVYTGTHDNDTLPAWLAAISPDARQQVDDYLGLTASDDETCQWLIRLAFSSSAAIAIVPLQDLIPSGRNGRMNTPGTTGGNWQWRFCSGDIPGWLPVWLRELSRIYGRNVKPAQIAQSGSESPVPVPDQHPEDGGYRE